MKVFISYTPDALQLARNAASSLRALGLDVWSPDSILPGDNWAQSTADALEESDAMVVIVTPNALDSTSVRHDIEFAIAREKYRGRLIPVIVGDSTAGGEISGILEKLHSIRIDGPDDIDTAATEISQALSEKAH